MRRTGFSLLAGSTALFALIGLGLSCAALAAQVINPTYGVLSMEQYQAYYSFFSMGEALTSFARFGLLAAGLMVLCTALWSADRMQVLEMLRLARRGYRFPLVRLALLPLQLSFLYLLVAFGIGAIVWLDGLRHPFTAGHFALVLGAAVGLPLAAAAALVAAFREVSYRDFQETWLAEGGVLARVAAAVLMVWALLGLVCTLSGMGAAADFRATDYLVPPLISTHFGPWGILGWVVGLFALVGLAAGLALCGLVPDESREPDSLHPIPGHRFALVAGISLVVGIPLVLSYPLYLVPRYHINQDLRQALDLSSREIQGRTVVFLDAPRAPHTVGAVKSWSTPENLRMVGRWLTTAPTPSALTRPAAAVVGNHALWEWDPDRALNWVQVQRERQAYSNLNRVVLEVLRSTMPTPVRRDHLTALTDPKRFVWPGAGGHLQVAEVLERYGHESEAQALRQEALRLGMVPHIARARPSGTITGRLVLEGAPLKECRVGLFRMEPSELLESVKSEQRLVGDPSAWRPGYYRYMDFRRLRDFYAVQSTDSEGRFLFEPVDDGRYVLALRLPGHSPLVVEDGTGVVEIGEGQLEVDLGEVALKR